MHVMKPVSSFGREGFSLVEAVAGMVLGASTYAELTSLLSFAAVTK